MSDRLFDTYAAAAYLTEGGFEISHWMVRKHCAAGHIVATQLGKSGHWLIEESALQDFASGNTFRGHRHGKFSPKIAVDLSDVGRILTGDPEAPTAEEVNANIDAALDALLGSGN